MTTMAETAYLQIQCKCGAGPFEDRETWVEHVRQGMPQIAPRQGRPDFRKQEQEQATMMHYIGEHGILEILPEESNSKERGL